MIDLVLAEDHHLVREGLRSMLESDPDFQVVAETGDGLEVLQLIKEHKPDVLILDLLLPGLHGLEIIKRVQNLNLRTVIVVVSMYDHKLYVRKSVLAGASGYVLKNSPAGILKEGIRMVISGSRYIDPNLPDDVLGQDGAEGDSEADLDPYSFLTDREREVMQLVVEGMTMRETGERLSISPRTVEKHRASLMNKLDVDNQSELVRFAVYRGLLGPPPSDSGEG